MDVVHSVGFSFIVDSLSIRTLCSKLLDSKVGGNELSKGLIIKVELV